MTEDTVAELAYHLLVAEDESVVEKDASIRFGDKARELLDKAREIVRYVVEEAQGDPYEAIQKLLEKYRIQREVTDRSVSLLIRYFMRRNYQPVPEQTIKDLYNLLELNVDVEKLVREGVLIHVREGYVTVPQFLISNISLESPDVELLLDEAEHNLTGLAVLEAWLEGSQVNVEFFEKLYGIEYDNALKSLHIRKIVKYSESLGDFVFNPLIDIEEFRTTYHAFKQSRAKKILRSLDIGIGHTKYSKRIGALVTCLAFGPGQHGIIIVAPWLVPTRRFERYCANVARLVVLSMPFRREFAEYYHQILEETRTFRNTAFVFIQEGVAYLVVPEKRGRSLDSLLDFIYRAGFEVFEF